MPIELKTRRNASGRSQAAVKAQIAPLLAPPMARSLPSRDSLIGRPSDGAQLLDLRQQLLEQEPDVTVAQAVVFEAAIEPIDRPGLDRLHPAVHHEDADGDGHLLAGDQLVEDRRRVVLDAVLVHVQAGRLRRIVLPRDVDPVIAHRAGEDLAALEGMLGDVPLGDIAGAGRFGSVGEQARRDTQGEGEFSDHVDESLCQWAYRRAAVEPG